MKKYTLHLISFKQRNVKDKKRREIVEVSFYDSITFDLAKYLAVKEDCRLIFFDKKDNPCYKDGATHAVGYTYFHGNGTIAFINKKRRKSTKLETDISIYPELKKVTLNRKIIDWRRFDSFLSKHENNFADYSIEAFDIWGPSSLIPKGYEQVTEGKVINGDYYFDKDHWLSVHVSFSSVKIGETIEQTGIEFLGNRTGRKENEVLNFYKKFIIRKKPKPV